MNVSLSKEQRRYIELQVVSGRYNNHSEVVRAGLRLLQDGDSEYQVKLRALKEKLDAALENLDEDMLIGLPTSIANLKAELERKGNEETLAGQAMVGCGGGSLLSPDRIAENRVRE